MGYSNIYRNTVKVGISLNSWKKIGKFMKWAVHLGISWNDRFIYETHENSENDTAILHKFPELRKFMK